MPNTKSAPRFTRRDFDNVIPSGTYYHIIRRAREDGYCQDSEEVWGEETKGRPLKSYKVESLRQWIFQEDKVTKPLKEKVLNTLDQIEG